MKTAVAHTRKVRNGSSRFLTTELVYYASAAPATPTKVTRMEDRLKTSRTTTERMFSVSTVMLFLLRLTRARHAYHRYRLSMKSSCRPLPSSPGK